MGQMSLYIVNMGITEEEVVRGAWLELPLCDATDDVEEAFEEWLKENVAYEDGETWKVYDYDCDCANLAGEFGDYPDIEELNELACRLADLDCCEIDIVSALLEEGYGLEEAISITEKGDVYLLYDVKDEEDYGYYLVDEGLLGINVPDSLKYYIDYEKIGRDVRLEGDIAFTSYGCLCGLNSI